MYATAICTSSRVELMTGQYGFNNGYFELLNGMSSPSEGSPYRDIAAKQSLARILRAKNYRTGIVGKWQLTGDPLRGMAYEAGFEEYYVWIDGRMIDFFPDLPPVEFSPRYWAPFILDNGTPIVGSDTDYGPRMFADWAVDFIGRHAADPDHPFFLYYPMVLVHKENHVYPEVPDENGGTIPGSLRAHVSYVDLILGRILNALQTAGVENDTMVIFTADNGSQWPGFKATPTEKGVRVPLIVQYPGVVAPGVRSRQVADFVDIAATIHDYTGPLQIPVAEPLLDGESLRPVLEDSNQDGQTLPENPHKEYAFGYYQNMRIIRDDQWVYQEVDENGNGNLFSCGSRRQIDSCEASLDADKIEEFQQVLLAYPPPNP